MRGAVWGDDAGLRAHEVGFLGLAVAVTRVGTEFGGSGTISPWFGPTAMGVPLHYLLFGGLLAAVSPYVINTPPFPLTSRLRQLGLLPYLIAAWAVLVVSIALAMLRHVPELFADWRNLLVVAVTAVFAAKWLGVQTWRRFALTDLASAYGLLAVPHLFSYSAGLGTTVLGVRTTVFDGTTLYLASFAAITAAWNLLTGEPSLGRTRTVLLRIAGVAGSLLVLLSFRRSFWLGWATGLATVAYLHLRHRNIRPMRLYAAVLGLIALIATAFVALGTDAVLGRLESFIPTNSGSYSATNDDHVNDLVDAWSVITTEPLLGLGIGVHYETNLIADWKTESFEVHNALLHVWLKFGIAGALTYLAFHLALARCASRHSISVPIAGFVIGELAATMVGTWPYGSFQMSMFHGLLLAILAVNVQTEVVPPRATPESVSVATAGRDH